MDWKEKELEDYVAAHPDELRDVLGEHLIRQHNASAYPFNVLGTQIPCDYGVIDMICTWIDTIYVVEFKAVRADEKAMGQAMRYVHYLECMFCPELYLQKFYPQIKSEIKWKVTPVLVAPSFARSLNNCHTPLITAEREDDGSFSLFVDFDSYEIDPHFEEKLHAVSELLKPFSLELVGRHVGQIAMGNLPTGALAR